MMNRIKMRLVLWWLKVTRKLTTDTNLSILKKDGTGINNALVILPQGQENSRVARYFLKSLQGERASNLDFLMDLKLYHTFDGPMPEYVHTYSVDDDISWINIPRKEFASRITNKKYDAIIDMHPSFNLSSAYLTLLSHAPIRIGFSSEFSEYFFNIEIERKNSDFIERGYEWIRKLLNL